jgi:hypothetical protein
MRGGGTGGRKTRLAGVKNLPERHKTASNRQLYRHEDMTMRGGV